MLIRDTAQGLVFPQKAGHEVHALPVNFSVNVGRVVNEADVGNLGATLDNERGTLDLQIFDNRNAVAVIKGAAIAVYYFVRPGALRLIRGKFMAAVRADIEGAVKVGIFLLTLNT